MPALHPRQRQVALDETRFRVLACGRRWGKTRLGSALCLAVAARGGRAWWCAPTYPISTVGWRLLRRMASQIPGAEVRQVDRLIILPTGGEIQVRSADNPDSLRGDALDFVVLDECAFMREEAWTEALRPALSDRLGRAMFISTPAGRNWYWRLWQRCQDPTQREWKGWQLPTSDNPYIDPNEIEAARQVLPERIFQQEYLAEFLDDAGGVFRGVAEMSTAAPEGPKPDYTGQYVFGIDWAFSHDYTAICVMDAVERRQVHLDRFNGVDYSLQRERILALAHRYRPSVIVAEANAMGRPNNEELRRAYPHVQDFTTGNLSKQEIIQALAGAIERGQITLLNDPVQIGELQAYEGERLPGGATRYGAPDGMHDDTVMALALAYQAIATRPRAMPAAQPEQESRWRRL